MQLVAIVPALLVAVLVAGQLVVLGYTVWSAGIAARAGARAAHVGDRARDVALRALPDALRRGASVSERARGVRVRLQAPSIVPGLPRVPVTAGTALDPSPDGD